LKDETRMLRRAPALRLHPEGFVAVKLQGAASGELVFLLWPLFRALDIDGARS
jgi:hypothetical protein